MKKFLSVRLVLLICISTILFQAKGYAAIESFHGSGLCILNKQETISQAYEIAYQEALRNIAEQAGVYITGRSLSVNGQIVQDELEMVSTTIVQVKDRKFQKEITSDGKIGISVTVQGELDTEQATKMLQDLVDTRKATDDYRRIQQEYEQSQSIFRELNVQYHQTAEQQAKHLLREGDVFRQAGQLDEARAKYEEAIAMDERLASAYSRRGYISLLQSETESSRIYAEKALSLDPADAGAHYIQAIIFDHTGQAQKAASEYRFFVQSADIMDYDTEIVNALKRIAVLSPKGAA